VMLPRSLDDLGRSVQEFTVAIEKGRVVGCGSLKFYDRRLAEIRSLSVEPGHQSHGVGKGLVKRLLREAEELSLETLFALTTVPGFFSNCGFAEVAREKFPAKIERDCLTCELYPTCAEKTVAIAIRSRKARAYVRPLAQDLPSLGPA
jgi:amino-acid N-acetyltransferase